VILKIEVILDKIYFQSLFLTVKLKFYLFISYFVNDYYFKGFGANFAFLEFEDERDAEVCLINQQ